MIGYVNYFTSTYTNGTTNFPNLGLVRTVKISCDVTVVYTNDNLHGVCFPTVILLYRFFNEEIAEDTAM